MKFCSACGTPVEVRIPEGDERERFVCPACDTIHYQNPNIVTGCIPEWRDQILLCRRAIEPRHGLWTLPAGFMENGETTQQGAARETWEEARAHIEVGELYSLFNLPRINQVYMLFRARLLDTDFGPGPESLEVRLFREDEIPWDEMAFPVVTKTLELYFADRKAGGFRLKIGDIERVSMQSREYRFSLLQG